MTLPSLLLGLVLSSLYGSIFHLIRGGNLGRLLLYLIFSWVGFWIGHILGGVLGWTFGAVGPLHLGMATLGSALMLLVGYWLSLVQVEKSKNK